MHHLHKASFAVQTLLLNGEWLYIESKHICTTSVHTMKDFVANCADKCATQLSLSVTDADRTVCLPGCTCHLRLHVTCLVTLPNLDWTGGSPPPSSHSSLSLCASCMAMGALSLLWYSWSCKASNSTLLPAWGDPSSAGQPLHGWE